MTFLEIFEEMHRKDQGVTSGALTGVDGLTVEDKPDGREPSATSVEPTAPSAILALVTESSFGVTFVIAVPSPLNAFEFRYTMPLERLIP